ncbi:MAG: type VI secretion system tube protein Hcp [Fimbriimonadaceae bacterium]|nr:type VI secretion system tube protein Hcp [Fimbriimonadaceae bacterium]
MSVWRVKILAGGLLLAGLGIGCGGGGAASSGGAVLPGGLNDFVGGASESLVMQVNGGTAGFKGDSTLTGYRDWINLTELRFGSEVPIDNGAKGGGVSAGLVRFDRLVVSKVIDRASPALAQANWSGSVLDRLVLVVVDTRNRSFERYRFDLTGALVARVEQSLVQGDSGLEKLSLAFNKIEITYRSVDASGAPGPPVTVGWDLTTNSAARAARLRQVGLLR